MLCCSANAANAAETKGPMSPSLEEMHKGATKISETAKQLTDRDCIVLATALKTAPAGNISNKVDSLDLFDNNITSLGAGKLAQALETDACQLRSLKLAYNAIGDTGAIRLAQALRHPNCKLEKLDLSGCDIEQAGAQAIIDSIKCNTRIKTVFLFGNAHELDAELKAALAGPRQPAVPARRSTKLPSPFRERVLSSSTLNGGD